MSEHQEQEPQPDPVEIPPAPADAPADPNMPQDGENPPEPAKEARPEFNEQGGRIHYIEAGEVVIVGRMEMGG